MSEQSTSDEIARRKNKGFVPDVEREDREWKRISCSCGGMLGMTNGTLLRIRHRDRGHIPGKIAYIYIDLSGDYPQVIAELPVRTGQER